MHRRPLRARSILREYGNRIFHPTDAEVEYAQRVVEAFEAAGAGTVDDQMVDLPVVERARRVLQLVSVDSSEK